MFLGRDENGRPVQVSQTVHGGKKEAVRVADEIASRSVPPKASRRTVTDVLEAWRVHKEPTWVVYTRRDQATRTRAIGEDRLGKISLTKLTVADVDAWVTRMRKAGVGESAIRNRLQALRAALTQAEGWGWISKNPAAPASARRPKTTTRGVMAIEDVQQVIDVAPDVHELAPLMVRLAAVTGARRGELAALKWDDLHGNVLVIDSAIRWIVRWAAVARPSQPSSTSPPRAAIGAGSPSTSRRWRWSTSPKRCGGFWDLGCSATVRRCPTQIASVGCGSGSGSCPVSTRRGGCTT